MWRTPKRKSSEFADAFLYEDSTGPTPQVDCERVEAKHHAHQKTPASWKGKGQKLSNFVKDFFSVTQSPSLSD